MIKKSDKKATPSAAHPHNPPREAIPLLDRALANPDLRAFAAVLQQTSVAEATTPPLPGRSRRSSRPADVLDDPTALATLDRFRASLASRGLRFTVAVAPQTIAQRPVCVPTLLADLRHSCLLVDQGQRRCDVSLAFVLASDAAALGRPVLYLAGETTATWAHRWQSKQVEAAGRADCRIEVPARFDLPTLRRHIIAAALDHQVAVVIVDDVQHIRPAVGTSTPRPAPSMARDFADLRQLAEKLDLNLVFVSRGPFSHPVEPDAPPTIEQLGVRPETLEAFDRFMLVEETGLAARAPADEPPAAEAMVSALARWKTAKRQADTVSLCVALYGWVSPSCQRFELRIDALTCQVTRRRVVSTGSASRQRTGLELKST